MVAPVYQGSGVKLVGDESSHHYKDPSERGKKQEMVAPVYQGTEVKLMGDGSSLKRSIWNTLGLGGN